MKLLEQTVRELKGEELEDDVRATVNLRVDLQHRRAVHAGHEPAADALPQGRRRAARGRRSIGVLEEAIDRYGPLPDSVLNLADYGRIRVMADRLGIEAIDREGAHRRLKVQTAGEGSIRSGSWRWCGGAPS